MEYDSNSFLHSTRFAITLIFSLEGIQEKTFPRFRGWAENSGIICCPLCGDVWGRVVAINYDTEKGEKHEVSWTPQSIVCRSCGNGSLLQLYALTRQFTLGPQLVRREIELALENANKRLTESALHAA